MNAEVRSDTHKSGQTVAADDAARLREGRGGGGVQQRTTRAETHEDGMRRGEENTESEIDGTEAEEGQRETLRETRGGRWRSSRCGGGFFWRCWGQKGLSLLGGGEKTMRDGCPEAEMQVVS